MRLQVLDLSLNDYFAYGANEAWLELVEKRQRERLIKVLVDVQAKGKKAAEEREERRRKEKEKGKRAEKGAGKESEERKEDEVSHR